MCNELHMRVLCRRNWLVEKWSERKDSKSFALTSPTPSKMGIFRINTEDIRGRDFGECEVNYPQHEDVLSSSVMQVRQLLVRNGEVVGDGNRQRS